MWQAGSDTRLEFRIPEIPGQLPVFPSMPPCRPPAASFAGVRAVSSAGRVFETGAVIGHLEERFHPLDAAPRHMMRLARNQHSGIPCHRQRLGEHEWRFKKPATSSEFKYRAIWTEIERETIDPMFNMITANVIIVLKFSENKVIVNLINRKFWKMIRTPVSS